MVDDRMFDLLRLGLGPSNAPGYARAPNIQPARGETRWRRPPHR